jgi:negative regulator of flagellin synthesis FlgM
MRIDLTNASAGELSSELSAQQVSAQSASQAATAGAEDRATFTSDSVSVQSLVSTALASPEVRQDKVDNLRLSVSSGQYELDPVKIAASMVDDYA